MEKKTRVFVSKEEKSNPFVEALGLGLLLLVLGVGFVGIPLSLFLAHNAGISLSGLIPSGSRSRDYVSQDDYLNSWPLTIPGGKLRCEGDADGVYALSISGYALNGTALAKGYKDIQPILADNPNPSVPGVPEKMSTMALESAALQLCK